MVQMGSSYQQGSQDQAAAIEQLRVQYSQLRRQLGGEVQGLRVECAGLKTQMTTEQKTQELLNSQTALIAHLRYFARGRLLLVSEEYVQSFDSPFGCSHALRDGSDG